MSDTEEAVEDKPFWVNRPKQGRAGCKKCKEKCETGELRIGKLQYNPFAGGTMKSWHHVDCMFEQFLKQRPTTKRLQSTDEIQGWDELTKEDQEFILKRMEECEAAIAAKYGAKAGAQKKSPKATKQPQPQKTTMQSPKATKQKQSSKAKVAAKQQLTEVDEYIPKAEVTNKIPPQNAASEKVPGKSKDTLFREFRKLVADITNVSSYTDKTALVSKMFTKGTDGSGFKGDVKLWCRLLLPGVVKRTYNLQSKQLVKLFSKIFRVNQNEMLKHLEQGDVGETIQHFFQESTEFKPAKKGLLTVAEVDEFLEELSTLTKEDEQMQCLQDFAAKCTSNELKIAVRLIKHDLRMNAGAKHVLDGVHPDAYQAYQASRDLDAVIDRCIGGTSSNSGKTASVKATITLMTPVRPMLAEACKSVEQAMKKCPNGMYSEVKYDGERVQVHKQGSTFKYFSRSLKPVMAHKVAHFKDFIPKAFPLGKDLILDGEILMIDTNTSKPLPFGTLGVHKKSEFKDACVCLFVFDCIYYNGETLTDKPIKLRKEILRENMTEIPNHVVLSELEEINKTEDLKAMIVKVLKLGLEGLVLKDTESVYEPGKRHWLKVKKDYLFDGAMADSADLIVLGAWYGTGKKGGMMSVFLMGCYDTEKKRFCDVCKVHTGHDDKTLERLQTELGGLMVKINSDAARLPDWLYCANKMIPDFVAKEPKRQPVWEVTGAEFTEKQSAEGISIRFPRVTRIRTDKTWKQATNLQELTELFRNSKEGTDVSSLMKDSDSKVQSDKEGNTSNSSPKRKADGSNSGEGTSKKRRIDEVEGDSKDSSCSTTSKGSLTNNAAEEPAEGVKKNSKNTAKKDVKNNLESSAKKIKKPIPDYFQNVALLMESSTKEKYAEWIRYFIAYGGVLVDEDDWRKATHILHLNDEADEQTIQWPNTARHIILDWIKDSISKRSLQDHRPYTVRLRPLEENGTSLKILKEK